MPAQEPARPGPEAPRRERFSSIRFCWDILGTEWTVAKVRTGDLSACYRSFPGILRWTRRTVSADSPGRSHEILVAGIDRVAKLLHEVRFFFVERTLLQGCQVFLKLPLIGWSGQTNVDVGIRQHKTITHPGVRDHCPFGPPFRASGQGGPAGGSIGNNSGIVLLQMREDVPLRPP